MKLWLVRHGETQANVDGLYSGHAPTPLPNAVSSRHARWVTICKRRLSTGYCAASWREPSTPPTCCSLAGLSPANYSFIE